MEPSQQVQLIEQARELQVLSEDMREQFEKKRKQLDSIHRRMRFFSRDRKDYWQMPAWLWIPAITVLCALLVFALIASGR